MLTEISQSCDYELSRFVLDQRKILDLHFSADILLTLLVEIKNLKFFVLVEYDFIEQGVRSFQAHDQGTVIRHFTFTCKPQ